MPTKTRTLRPKHIASPARLKRDTDARRRERSPWRAWYSTPRWRDIRAAQLTREPLCGMCAIDGGVVPATICDHVEPHRGDPVKFYAGPFQSLCKWHHDSAKQRAENKGAGAV